MWSASSWTSTLYPSQYCTQFCSKFSPLLQVPIMSTSKQQSPLESFLLSQSTLLCLAVRLALLFDYVPKDMSQLLQHPAVSSLILRSADHPHHDDTLFGNATQRSTHHLPVVQLLLILLADLVTAYALVYLGNVLRKEEDQDEEEKITNAMPLVIRPPTNAVFGTTETQQRCLIPRRKLPILAGNIYFWGTMLASSSTTTTHIYSGLACNILNVVTGNISSSSSDSAFAPVFLIPIYLSMKNKNKKNNQLLLVTLLMTMATLYYYAVTLPHIKFEIPIFSTPNLGVQWYFSMQLFDRFRPYFGIMFSGLRYILILPLAVRFSAYPMELTTCYWFIYMLFQVQPTVTDLAVALSLMLLCPRSLCRMTIISSLICLCAIPVPLILYCLDWHMWLETGTGNANFIFFQCLAYNVFCATLFIEFCGATVRRQVALQLTVCWLLLWN